jgi:hypothetical protein
VGQRVERALRRCGPGRTGPIPRELRQPAATCRPAGCAPIGGTFAPIRALCAVADRRRAGHGLPLSHRRQRNALRLP